MRSSRLLLLAAGAVLTTLVTLTAGGAQACPGQDGECACAKAAAAQGSGAPADKTACACAPGEDGKCAKCGTDCPSLKGGECKHAAACPCAAGADGKCADCGADCPSLKDGKCKHAAAEGKPASCGACAGNCAGAAAAPEGEHLKATIDPSTGAFVEPADDDAAPGAAKAATEPAREIQQPGGGVMVAAPADRMPKAVATIDESGKAHSGCAE